MKKSRYHIFLIWIAFAFLLPMTVGGAEELSFSPSPSEKIDIMKQMRVTIGRSVLPEGTNPQALHRILERGQIAIFDETTEEIPWLLSSGILINATPEQVWRVIIGHDKFPEWVPSCCFAKSTKIDNNIYDVTLTLGFKFIFFPLYVKYSVRQYNQPPLRNDWVGLGGTIEKTYGWSQNIPVDGDTMYFHTNWSQPGSGLLKRLYQKYPFLDVGINISAGTVYARNVKKRVDLLKGEDGSEVLESDPSEELKINREEELKIMELLTSRGPLLFFKKSGEGKPSEVTTWITFAAPPERVWADLADYGSYRYFMPMMKGIKVREQESNKARVEYKYDINIVFFSSKIKYQLEYNHYEPERITWTNIKGNRYVLSGSWELFPLNDGKKTLASYRVHYDTRSLGFLPRLLMKVIPEGELAINSYFSSISVRELRDWIEAPAELRRKLKGLKKKEKKKLWQEWKGNKREHKGNQGQALNFN